MSSYEENYLNKRPQELCHMCGKCCRVVTTSIPYDKLLELQNNGDKAACDFLGIFVPFKTIEDAKKADCGTVENIIAQLKADNNYNESQITFYTCKYLQDDNKCSIYEKRPTLCRHCPSTPWAIVPPGCGLAGWLFRKREEEKERVRKAKEELLELQVLKNKVNNPDTLNKIKAVEHKIQRTIDMYKKYGSENW